MFYCDPDLGASPSHLSSLQWLAVANHSLSWQPHHLPMVQGTQLVDHVTGNGENQGMCPLIAVEGGVADMLLCCHHTPQGLVSVGVAQGLSIQQETEGSQIWVWFSMEAGLVVEERAQSWYTVSHRS